MWSGFTVLSSPLSVINFAKKQAPRTAHYGTPARRCKNFHSLPVNQYRIAFTNNKATEIVFTIAFSQSPSFQLQLQCNSGNGNGREQRQIDFDHKVYTGECVYTPRVCVEHVNISKRRFPAPINVYIKVKPTWNLQARETNLLSSAGVLCVESGTASSCGPAECASECVGVSCQQKLEGATQGYGARKSKWIQTHTHLGRKYLFPLISHLQLCWCGALNRFRIISEFYFSFLAVHFSSDLESRHSAHPSLVPSSIQQAFIWFR